METKSYNSLGGTIGSLYVPWNAVLHKVNPSDTTKLKKKTRHKEGEREGGRKNKSTSKSSGCEQTALPKVNSM